MSFFRILAGLAINSAAPIAPTHRAGTPTQKAGQPHVDGPWFRPVGNGCVEFADDWQEAVWPAIDWFVTVPEGYVSDGYSIPKIAWLIVGHPFGQEHMVPAFIHDYLCDKAQSYEQRVLADAAFFHLMEKYEVPGLKRAVFYIAVRFWGRWTWKMRGGNHA